MRKLRQIFEKLRQMARETAKSREFREIVKNVINRDRAILKSIHMSNKTYLVLKNVSKKTSYVTSY